MKYFSLNSPCVYIGLLIFIIILSQSRGLESKGLVSQNPFDLYQDKILFDVVRGGEKVGSHEATFSGDKNDFWVTTRFELEIKVLFIRAYAFKYFSKANWKNGVLNEISVIVDDDGEPFSLKGRKEAGEFLIESSKKKIQNAIAIVSDKSLECQCCKRERCAKYPDGRTKQGGYYRQGRRNITKWARRNKKSEILLYRRFGY